MRGSRSSLRRIGVPYDGRRRWYLLRALCVALIIAAVVAFLIAVQTQFFAKEGLGAAIYGFHDRIYLWAKGQAWVQFFPYALIWLVPCSLALALVLVEFATPMGPIRSLHRRLTLGVVKYGWTQRFLARPLGTRQIKPDVWVASLTPTAHMRSRWFGFARRVVQRAQEKAWRQLAVALAEGMPITPKRGNRLALLSGMRLRFDPSDSVGHLRALEVIAAAPSLPEVQNLTQRLSDFYAAQEDAELVAPLAAALDAVCHVGPDHPNLASAQMNRVTASLQAVTKAELSADAPANLACLALVASVIGWRCQLPDVASFQRLWVKSRLMVDPPDVAPAIEIAEGLIFFELWSKLAEIVPVSAQDRSLLALALGSQAAGMPGLINAPEQFAWTGGSK